MTANSTIRAWLRDAGENVSQRGQIPAALTEKYYQAHPAERPAGSVRLLPGPDDDLDAWEDLGEIAPEGPESDADGFSALPADSGNPPLDAERLSADPEPAHAKREWRKGSGGRQAAGSQRRPGRVTAGVRADIGAKISFALEIPGRIWQARDPACGGTFVEQRPQISDALTEIVCQSPDLIAWFSGSGGQFMLWLNLAAACWPVATVVMAHHVYHTLEEVPVDAQQPDYGQYAA